MRVRTLMSVLAALGLVAGVASAQVDLVINEILYDGPGTDAGMFTEIKGPGDFDLTGYSLVGVNGSDGADYRTISLDGMVIPADGYLVIGQDTTVVNVDYIDSQIDWQNGPDEVELRFDIDVVDAICYGYSALLNCEGGTNGPDVAAGNSISRCPDGVDTNNNELDTRETTPTPGVENDCPTGGPTDMTLCEAVTLDSNGFPIHEGEWIHITDPMIILNDPDVFTLGSLEAGATDGECCILLFNFDYTEPLYEGDEIDATGTLDFYNGKIELSGPDMEITVLSTGNPLPAPEFITTEELATNGNMYESCLIGIQHLFFTGGADPWPPEGENANVEVVDFTGVPTIMRIDKETNIDGSTPPEEPFTALGIGGQYDSSSPYTEGFQFEPRSLADIYYDPSPVQPSTWGRMKEMFK